MRSVVTDANETSFSLFTGAMMIVVTGAAGQLGRQIVEKLCTMIDPHRIAVSVRDPNQVEVLAERGVRVRRGDFDDAASLAAAFDGAEQVLIVSANKLGEEARRLHRNAIEAALAAGARRILYTSHMGARTGSSFAPGDQHAGTEDDLTRAGVPFTSLRHGFYAESCLMMVGDALRQGELRVPEDGPVSWTTRADLAEADAAILAGRASFEGLSPPLTATTAITMSELAAIASEVGGRKVRHTTVADEEWRSAKIAAGTPELYADMLLGMFQAARRGDFAETDPALGTLLGRKPVSMREVLSEHLTR